MTFDAVYANVLRKIFSGQICRAVASVFICMQLVAVWFSGLDQRSCATSGTVSTRICNRLWAGKPR